MFFSFKRLAGSVSDAARGWAHTWRAEQNFRLQVVVGALVLVGAWFFPLRLSERLIICLLVILVLVMELINTALEKMADIVVPRLHEQIALVKNVMAAAVLSASLGAAAVGIIIFWPYLLAWYNALVG